MSIGEFVCSKLLLFDINCSFKLQPMDEVENAQRVSDQPATGVREVILTS
jgi:hypothetical protein